MSMLLPFPGCSMPRQSRRRQDPPDPSRKKKKTPGLDQSDRAADYEGGHLDDAPITGEPGSPEKIEAMRARVRERKTPCNPEIDIPPAPTPDEAEEQEEEREIDRQETLDEARLMGQLAEEGCQRATVGRLLQELLDGRTAAEVVRERIELWRQSREEVRKDA